MTSFLRSKPTALIINFMISATNKSLYKKQYLAFFSIAVLSGCNMASTLGTNSTIAPTLNTNVELTQRMDSQCIKQVQTQQSEVLSPSVSQSLMLANSAQHCVSDIHYSPAHPDNKTAMQFSALAFVNYIKAGDMNEAKMSLTTFRATFPQQDLLFTDYTSFVDTATVLVNQRDISAYQLTTLNINPTLRAEITRQRKWSLR